MDPGSSTIASESTKRGRKLAKKASTAQEPKQLSSSPSRTEVPVTQSYNQDIAETLCKYSEQTPTLDNSQTNLKQLDLATESSPPNKGSTNITKELEIPNNSSKKRNAKATHSSKKEIIPRKLDSASAVYIEQRIMNGMKNSAVKKFKIADLKLEWKNLEEARKEIFESSFRFGHAFSQTSRIEVKSDQLLLGEEYSRTINMNEVLGPNSGIRIKLITASTSEAPRACRTSTNPKIEKNPSYIHMKDLEYWKTLNLKETVKLEFESEISSCDFNSDGSLVAICHGSFAHIYSTESTNIRRIGSVKHTTVGSGELKLMKLAKWSPKEPHILFTSGYNGVIQKWNLSPLILSSQALSLDPQIELKVVRSKPLGSSTITCLSISPDGSYIASGSSDKLIEIWDTSTMQHVRSIGKAPLPFFYSTDKEEEAENKDGIVNISKIKESVYNTASSRIGPFEPVNFVSFSPDSRMIAASSLDSSIRVWEVSTGLLTHRFDLFPNIDPIPQSINNDRYEQTKHCANSLLWVDDRSSSSLSSEPAEFNIIATTIDGSIRSFCVYPDWKWPDGKPKGRTLAFLSSKSNGPAHASCIIDHTLNNMNFNNTESVDVETHRHRLLFTSSSETLLRVFPLPSSTIEPLHPTDTSNVVPHSPFGAIFLEGTYVPIICSFNFSTEGRSLLFYADTKGNCSLVEVKANIIDKLGTLESKSTENPFT